MLDAFTSAIDPETLLTVLGIKFEQVGDELKAICPNPAHLEKDASWSMNCDPESDRFGSHHCFGCGFGGGVITLVMKVLNTGADEAEDFIAELFDINLDLTSSFAQDRLLDFALMKRVQAKSKKKLRTQFAPQMNLRQYRSIEAGDDFHWYLKRRKVTFAQVKKYDLRKCLSGFYKNRVIIPLQDVRGVTVSFYARAIFKCDQKHKGRYPKGKNTVSTVLFGLQFVDPELKCAIVTEGAFDQLRIERAAKQLAQHGLGNPLAILGGNITPVQVKELSRFEEVIALGDGDAGGKNFCKKIEDALLHKCRVKTGVAPEGFDPDDLATDDLVKLLLAVRNDRKTAAFKIKY